MPLIAFGFDLSTNHDLGKIKPDLITDLHFLEKFPHNISVDEFFCYATKSSFTAFAAVEDREKLFSIFIEVLQQELSMPAEKIRTYSFRSGGRDAIHEFLTRAIGWPNFESKEFSKQKFREQFRRAREEQSTGPLLNRLYQRSVWLAEKIRIKLVLQENAVTPESVVVELAEKIFGSLQDHSALIVPGTEQLDACVDRLYASKIGGFFFLETESKTENNLIDKYKGELVGEENFSNILEKVDLLLMSDSEPGLSLHKQDISRVMDRRKNAPLLWLNLSSDESMLSDMKTSSSHYNVYYYNIADLNRIVESNLKQHQKSTQLVEKLIGDEVENFLNWVNSNDRFRFGDMIGKSKSMQRILDLIAQIAQTDISVMIDGESGTGKELVARAIHQHSSRVKNEFLVVNCGAIPDSLLESELFGHVRGAFTGATTNKKGLFEAANHGTIFLDEIGETSLSMQVKLLRFLQEGEIKPVGSNATLNLDVRLITATNKDLEKMVEEGTFRQDLYYRLNVIQITVPPLRDRSDDILPLVEFFIKKYNKKMHKMVSGVEPEAIKALMEYHWPGNIRELENAIERAVALCAGNLLSLKDFPTHITTARLSSFDNRKNENISLKELEKHHIEKTLAKNDWNYELVTKLLGIGRTTLWRKMKAYNISNGD